MRSEKEDKYGRKSAVRIIFILFNLVLKFEFTMDWSKNLEIFRNQLSYTKFIFKTYYFSKKKDYKNLVFL